MNPESPTPTPSALTAEDSKRVADAIIAAIERIEFSITNRVDAMCASIQADHYRHLNND